MNQARLIASQVLAGTRDPNEACAALAELCKQSGWPTELTPFTALEHEQHGHEQLGFNATNTVPLILEECRLLLDLKA